MPRPYTDPNALPPDPATLPRGLISPPQEVFDVIAREKARHHTPWGREYEIRIVNDLTLEYYFEGHVVAYRQTPEGPEVLGVGEEAFDYLDRTPPEQRKDVVIVHP